MRSALFAVMVALVSSACCNRVCCPPTTACAEPLRRFVVLRASPIPDPQGGPTQVFIDGSVLTVPQGARVHALDAAMRLEGRPAPVWLAGSPVSDESFGKGVRVVNAPKILAIDGQDATVFVGENNRDGTVHSGWHLAVTPVVRADQVHLTVAYRHHEGGRLVDSIPATPIEGPAGQTFIIESRSD